MYDAPLGTADHAIVTAYPIVTSNVQNSPKTVTYHRLYDFRLSNVQSLYLSLSHVDWDDEFSNVQDTNELWSLFQNTVMHLIARTIPSKMVPLTSKDKGWMTPLTKSLINQR